MARVVAATGMWLRQPPRQYSARREPASAGAVIGVPFLWASKDLYRDVLMLHRPWMAVSSASDSADGTSLSPLH
ncbi:MAG: hypothetical protein GXP13_09885 [Gammaproteobacteria bacterium]|nr:hypothetical protein [Gammaproteobacteria bacterium]